MQWFLCLLLPLLAHANAHTQLGGHPLPPHAQLVPRLPLIYPRPVFYHGGVQHPEIWSLGPVLEKLLKFSCPEVAEQRLEKGEVAYPHPRDCSKYYVCDVNGTAEEYDCLFPLTGLLFSASTGSCEWASQVHCFGLDAELGEDIEAVVEEEEIDFSCLWQGDFEDPEFCMRYYHCDKNLRASLNYCSTGNFFQPIDDKGSGSCSWAASVACGTRSDLPPALSNEVL